MTVPRDTPSVYPRVGGGNMAEDGMRMTARGLSPRGRGKPKEAVAGEYGIRSIPAWAGETEIAAGAHSREKVYPRVGGGNPHASDNEILRRGLSPRGRGKPLARRCDKPLTGSIPAWAGETPEPGTADGCARVYPRVGGGNPANGLPGGAGVGLSPRGRGKPGEPAWA